MAEAGLAGIEAPQWFVVAAPAGVPADRLQKINEAIAEILKQPEVMDQFTKMGLEPAAASPQETTKFVSEDLKRWKDLAQKANLQLD
jgi:tripartite-type tricarboxylate transporter receptor subunit TctC